MPRIERLSEDLVNKIAAGEVVERPASVVKELVENALDASARSISVEIENGGKSLIRVRDDGCGMDREDAALAIERHATSKLRCLPDLQAIATHGFRGEALPSIASVSHLVLRTRDETGPAGTEVEVRHGRLIHVKDVGHPRGATVEVRELFGAVPARRKFLRADSTESAHVAETVTLLALARPETGFALRSAGRTMLEAPACGGLAERVYQLFGGAVLDDLLVVDAGGENVKVCGYISRPDRPIGPRAALRLFVNRRAVRDRGVSRAILEAYRVAGASARRPEALLFLEVPLERVDVNVHPAKVEVRFADPRSVFAMVEAAVRRALSEGVQREPPRADTSRVGETVARYFSGTEWTGSDATGAPKGSHQGAGPQAAGASVAAKEQLLPLSASEELRVLGQHRATYIVASDGTDLLLVDQHTAHERARYEDLLARLESRTVESQLLVTPLVITLSPRLRPVLIDHGDVLRDLGFEIEEFGGDSVRVRALPTLLGRRDPAPALEDLLSDFLERESASWSVLSVREKLAATLACHSVVRAGQSLNQETMTVIVRDLLRIRHPTLCPHGRPTMVRIPRDDVARWFGRTGWGRE